MQPSNNYRMQMSLDFKKSSQKIERFAIVKIHLYKGAYLQIQIYDVACWIIKRSYTTCSAESVYYWRRIAMHCVIRDFFLDLVIVTSYLEFDVRNNHSISVLIISMQTEFCPSSLNQSWLDDGFNFSEGHSEIIYKILILI